MIWSATLSAFIPSELGLELELKIILGLILSEISFKLSSAETEDIDNKNSKNTDKHNNFLLILTPLLFI